MDNFGDDVPEDGNSEVSQRQKKRLIDRVLLYNRLERVEGTSTHLVNLLLYVWAQDDSGRSCPYIQMRNTLLISNGVPRHWLFTDKQGRLRRKNSLRLKDKEDIVRQIAPPSCPGHQKSCIHITPDGTKNGATVKEMDAKDLRELLNRDGALPDGLLQTFVRSFSDNSEFITATWYPNFFYVERSQMKNGKMKPWEKPPPEVVQKVKADPMQQAFLRPSMDGDDRRLLTKKLMTVCNVISRHVTAVSPQKYAIACMRLHFKHDTEGKLWLMYCSFLDLQPGDLHLQDISLNIPRHPVEINNVPAPAPPRPQTTPLIARDATRAAASRPLSPTHTALEATTKSMQQGNTRAASKKMEGSQSMAGSKRDAFKKPNPPVPVQPQPAIPKLKTIRFSTDTEEDKVPIKPAKKVAASAMLIGLRKEAPMTASVFILQHSLPKAPMILPYYSETMQNLRIKIPEECTPSRGAPIEHNLFFPTDEETSDEDEGVPSRKSKHRHPSYTQVPKTERAWRRQGENRDAGRASIFLINDPRRKHEVLSTWRQ
ncbi:hypothetical protein CYMTET_10434 [Cymbomonas tetramitiformis]|uniref:Uncharacterized protein n=1 Tax=Cymbomonas tetramitiformis TaxID=36881 RepID=A0AAE0LDV5_9CHLO|nr:hypothetical protein CYMTET_10434 [Cymbomonas tetramitiformis]